MPDNGTVLYELKVYATGEVRDADGNLLNEVPVESVQLIDAETARSLTEEVE